MQKPSRHTGVVYLALATLFWAANYIVAEQAVTAMDPVSLVLWRWVVAVVPLFVVAQLLEKPDWKVVWRQWPWLLVLSLLGLTGYNLMLYGALEHIPALDASLINAFSPAVIAVAAAVFLHQRLDRLGVGGVLVALVGVLVVITDGDWSTLALLAPQSRGQLLMVGAVLVWAAYTVIGRVAPPLPPISSTFVQALFVIVAVLPVTVLQGGPMLPANASVAWSIVFIAIFPSVLAYVLWNKALATVPPARAGVFLNLVAAYTALFSLIAGRSFHWPQLVGGALVVCGVILTNLRAFTTKPNSPTRRGGDTLGAAQQK